MTQIRYWIHAVSALDAVANANMSRYSCTAGAILFLGDLSWLSFSYLFWIFDLEKSEKQLDSIYSLNCSINLENFKYTLYCIVLGNLKDNQFNGLMA